MTGQPIISVIDDDESLRTALVGLVRSYGYEARGFDSAEDFLQSGNIDGAGCIISDIQMSGMSGIELKRDLTARQCMLPVIMITARPEPAIERDAWASGALCVLKKPFEAETLMDCVARALKLPPAGSAV